MEEEKKKGDAGVVDEDGVIVSSLKEYIKLYRHTPRQEFQIQRNKQHYNSSKRSNPSARCYLHPRHLSKIRRIKAKRRRESGEVELPGMIAGLVSFQYQPPGFDEYVVDASSALAYVPIFIDKVGPICERVRDPLFILLVESRSVFLTLSFQKFYERFPCVMLHSWKNKHGHPDYATRWFLKKLHSELRLPVLALTDFDPQGVKLLSVYKWGMGSDTIDLSIPDLIWLGLTPPDLTDHGILNISTFPISDKERASATPLLAQLQNNDNYCDLKMHLQSMIRCGQKAAFKDAAYIWSYYLPLKLQQLSISGPLKLQNSVSQISLKLQGQDWCEPEVQFRGNKL